MRGMSNGKLIEGSVSIAALFDSDTGAIMHLHRVVQFGGAKKITPEYVQQRTRELYARTGRDDSRLRAITIDPTRFKRGGRYKVDLETFVLVEIAR
jgi:hypothetical protein